MYAETGLFFPYMQNFSYDFQRFEDYCNTQKPNASMSSTISEYDMGGDGDLFKAPEPIIEESVVDLDAMNASISLISCGEDVIMQQELKAANIESFRNEQLLEVLYECERDLMAQAAIGMPLEEEVFDIKISVLKTDENRNQENEMLCDVPFSKSVSSSCLSSIEPSFDDFQGMDFGSVYRMRRAFSDGDIKTLGNGNVTIIHSPFEQPLIVTSCSNEDRREKLSRYRNKKNKRNFGRKIKYACRKALADSQPRIRGRFAKTEESDNYRRH